MKKLIMIVTMLALCISMVCPAFAAESGFVPSITYKGVPEVVTVKDAPDEAGVQVVATVRGEEGEALGYLTASEVNITTIASIENDETISEESKEALLKAYEDLSTGAQTLPYDQVEGIDPEKMVVRELMYVSWTQDNDASEEQEEGTVMEFTFDLGLEPDTVVVVMAYVDGEWVVVEDVVVNEDGTVTIGLAQMGLVAICVET